MRQEKDRISEYVREYRMWMWVQRVIIIVLTAVIAILVLRGRELRDGAGTYMSDSADIPAEPGTDEMRILPDEQSSGVSAVGSRAIDAEDADEAVGDAMTYSMVSYDDMEAAAEAETAMQYEWLQAHRSLFPGGKVSFAEGNAGLIRFMYLYGNESYTVPQTVSLTDDELLAEIPLLLQWDDRWGFDAYGDNVIGISGCGPTALSMVAVGLTGDSYATPRAIAQYASANGLYLYGTGTKWALFGRYASENGLRCEDLHVDRQAIISALSDGKPVICSVKKGTFTLGGHFIVLTAIDEDGGITINDPNDPSNSDRKWQLSEFQSEISNAWAFSVR